MPEVDNKININLEYYKSIYNNIVVEKDTVRIFSSLKEEYVTLYHGAAFRDISNQGLIELKGKDSLDYLHRVSTNKILNLPDNSVSSTIFTNEKGRIIDRVKLFNFGEFQLLLGSGIFKHKLLSWINKYIIAEDIRTFDAKEKYSVFEITGNQAETFLNLIFDRDIDALKLNEIRMFTLERSNFWIIKTTEFGVHSFLIICGKNDGLFLFKHMNENKSVFDFRPVGEDAYNIFRIEKGIPSAPNELDDEYNPHEANLIMDVSFNKGCYIGQEVIARLDTYDKVQKHLKGIVFENQVDVNNSYNLFKDITEVGKVTSITYSPSLKKNIGLAYIKKDNEKDGSILTAKDSAGNEFSVSVCGLPLKK